MVRTQQAAAPIPLPLPQGCKGPAPRQDLSLSISSQSQKDPAPHSPGAADQVLCASVSPSRTKAAKKLQWSPGVKEVLLSLHSALARVHLEFWVQSWTLWFRRGRELLDRVQGRL